MSSIDQDLLTMTPDADGFFNFVETTDLEDSLWDNLFSVDHGRDVPVTLASSDDKFSSSDSDSCHSPLNQLPFECSHWRDIPSSAVKKGEKKPSPWTKDEQEVFLAGLVKFGCDKAKLGEDGRVSVGLGPGVARKIANMIGTRNALQVRSHAQKHFQRLGRQQGLAC